MEKLSRLVHTVRTISKCFVQMPLSISTRSFSLFQNPAAFSKLLTPTVPLVNSTCGLKVKGKVRRRCKDCFFVIRDERLYNICKTHRRHKQMAMKRKPHNTWILTHATQSQVRPW